MAFSKDIGALLQLGRHERKVLDSLTSTPKLPSQVVRESGVPNASAYLAFDRLRARGLAERKKLNHKHYWVRASPVLLAGVLASTINELEHVKNASIFKIEHKETTSITVHRGAAAIRKVIFSALDLNPHERFHIFQSANLDDGWMRVIGFANVLRVNGVLKKKKIIGESFIPENYFSNLLPHWGKKWAESYVDRLNIIYLLPKEFMPSHAEILLFRDRVLVLHIQDEIAVEVKDAEMLLMFKMLFEYLKTVARKVDPQEFLAQQL